METALNGGFSLSHYYSNVTIHCKLQPTVDETTHAVCVTGELSVVGSNLTRQQSVFVSDCGSRFAYDCVASASCQSEASRSQCVDAWRPYKNISKIWVLDAVLERGYDLIVTVEGSAGAEIPPKRYVVL